MKPIDKSQRKKKKTKTSEWQPETPVPADTAYSPHSASAQAQRPQSNRFDPPSPYMTWSSEFRPYPSDGFGADSEYATPSERHRASKDRSRIPLYDPNAAAHFPASRPGP